jgi:hypothetical protein
MNLGLLKSQVIGCNALQRSDGHDVQDEGQQRQRGGRGDAKSRSSAPKLAQAKRLFTNKAALVRAAHPAL